MATLTKPAFRLKWQERFRDNDTFDIDEADLREFAQDVVDTFGLGDAAWNYRGTFVVPTAPDTLLVSKGDVFRYEQGLWQVLEAGTVRTAPAAGAQWRQLLRLGYQYGGIFTPGVTQAVKLGFWYGVGSVGWAPTGDMNATAAPVQGANWQKVYEGYTDAQAQAAVARLLGFQDGGPFVPNTQQELRRDWVYTYGPMRWRRLTGGVTDDPPREGPDWQLVFNAATATLSPTTTKTLGGMIVGEGLIVDAFGRVSVVGLGSTAPGNLVEKRVNNTDETNVLIGFQPAAGDFSAFLNADCHFASVVGAGQTLPSVTVQATFYGGQPDEYFAFWGQPDYEAPYDVYDNGQLVRSYEGRPGAVGPPALLTGELFRTNYVLSAGVHEFKLVKRVTVAGATPANEHSNKRLYYDGYAVGARAQGTAMSLANYNTKVEDETLYGVATRTTTVVTFTQHAEYAQVNTTFSVDPAGARVGKVVRIRLGVSATAPTIPSTGFTKLTSTVFTPGKVNQYSFCVAADGTIDYYITVLP